jgi:hypothetical protein
MTNKEFQVKLQAMYNEYPMIAKSERKTVNELFYVLRMDKEHDYNVCINNGGFISCVTSVKQCFIDVKTLAKHIKKVECDEEDYGCKEICLNIVIEK